LLPAVAFIFIASCFWVDSIMHESDQASVIDGALRLARGTAPFVQSGFYEYDKYFASYWVLAGIYRLLPCCDTVLLANLLSFAVFWSGLFIIVCRGKQHSHLRSCLILACLVSPAFIVHLPYFAPNFLSAGMLFTGAAILGHSRCRTVATVVCWALAVAFRADALLLVPLLAWAAAQRASFLGLLGSLRTWTIALSMAAVYWCGQHMGSEAGAIAYSPFFAPKVYAGYFVFGLGSGTIALVALTGLLMRAGIRSPSTDERYYWWAGAVALAVPFVFYSLFMFSPRHWTILLTGLTILLSSTKWQTLAEGLPSLPRRALCTTALLAALLPAVVGIRLPAPTKPRLTLFEPTRFPTADGRSPMGALLPFMFSSRRLDHNHAAWVAARAVDKWQETDSIVPIAATPLHSILELAVRLKGQSPILQMPGKHSGTFVYTSCRSLLKRPHDLGQRAASAVHFDPAMQTPVMVSGQFPSGIIRLDSLSPASPGKHSDLYSRIQILNQVFAGNEFMWIEKMPAGSFREPTHWEGCTTAFLADHPFTIDYNRQTHAAMRRTDDHGRPMFVVCLPGTRAPGAELVLSHDVRVAISTYPDYMQLERL